MATDYEGLRGSSNPAHVDTFRMTTNQILTFFAFQINQGGHAVKQFLFCLLMLATVIPAVSPAPVAASVPQGVVQGSVLSAETNQPLADVSIEFRRLHPAKPPKTVRTVSDAAGKFTATLPPGSYTCIVSKEGFGTREETAEVDGTEPVNLPIPLNREARISGRLTDSAGKPLQGMKVSFGKHATAVTDAAGRFSVVALDPGWYELQVAHPEWVAEKQVSFSLSAGERKDAGDVTLRKSGALSVRLTAGGRPVSRAEVSLSGELAYRYGRTDTSGKVVFGKLPPGSYTLESYDERLMESKTELEVAEGKVTPVQMKAVLRPPSLSLDDPGRVILPGGVIPLHVRGLWVDGARITLHAVDEARLLDGSADPERPETIPADALKRVREFSVTLKKQRMTFYRSATLQIQPLPPGCYLVEATGGTASGRSSFLVTRLGLVAKASRQADLLFAADLVDGRALEGVGIRVVPVAPGASAAAQLAGTSDASGLLSLRSGERGVRIIGKKGDNLAFLNLAGEKAQQAGTPLKGYLYTERPAYRPGQTIYFKGVLRKTVGEGFALPGTVKVRVTLTDSGDQTLLEKEYGLSAKGSFNGEFALPGQPPLGDYTLKAESGDMSWQTTFKVLEYRKPEFEVIATAPGTFHVGGDAVPVALKARYYFGAPVADAKVSWRVYARPYYRSDDDRDREGDGAEADQYGGYADFLGEGEARTDGRGEALIPLATQPVEYPRACTVEVDVSDSAGRVVSSSAGFVVTPSLIDLSVRPLSYLSSPGRSTDIALTAGTWEGKPLRANVAVSIEEQVFDKKTHLSSFRKVDERAVTTDASGRAVFGQLFPRPGYWRVTATTIDERGLKAVGTGWIWVWREGFAWDTSYRELEVELDKKSYRAGETARLIVKSPAAGASLLLSVEGREIYSSRVVPMNGSVEVVELPVSAEYAPYVFVSAVMIDKGRFYSRTKTLRIDSTPDLLKLKVDADRPVYAPGDTVRLTVSASGNDGRPREAELSVAVVDEALYAVAPERRQDIYRFFRGTREHLVTTLNSFPRVYLGGAPKAAAAAFSAEKELRGVKVRKVFKDTAFWLPVLATGTDGSATVQFVLPDNLTTWRATAVGHDDQSEFGSGRGKFIARLDVMARLQPPRFLTVGDELRIPGIITNMTDSERQVSGIFEVEGLSLLGESRFSGQAAAGGTLRRDMAVRADAPGEALLRMRALAGDRGDAMELTLPVHPAGMKRISEGNIVLRGTQGETAVVLPADALPEGAALKLDVAPTLTDSLNGSLQELIDFPYGCVEQTMSRFLPAVRVKQLLGSKRYTLDPQIADKLDRVLEEGLLRLYDFQHEDGGWGWWKEDATDTQMTAHVMYGLALARKAGIPVRDASFERGIQSLAGRMQKGSTEDLPSLYRAYTLAGRSDMAAEKRIEEGWKRLRPSRRVEYVEALLNAGSGKRAGRLLDDAKSGVKHEGSAAYLKDDDAYSWWYSRSWSGSAVETTALLLEDQLAVDPKDPVASQLAEFLVRKRSGRWWNTTRGTAAVVVALARYAAATGETDASFNARLSLNGRELERYAVEKGKVTTGRTALTIPMKELRRGENRLMLERDGTDGVLYLSANLAYFVPPEAASQSPGLTVERKLYRLSPRRDGGEWRMEYLPLQPGEMLAPGDELEVRLTVDNREEMNFVIIEDRLPAGFEVRETKNDPRFAVYSGYWDWYAHQERHDERMAFFLDILPAGRHEFRYVVYPELEGDVTALPASVWPMYVPSLRSESGPWRVKVKK
jgi:uncharacterized protein YfaS (alpha-2-macroglobulin family)